MARKSPDKNSESNLEDIINSVQNIKPDIMSRADSVMEKEEIEREEIRQKKIAERKAEKQKKMAEEEKTKKKIKAIEQEDAENAAISKKENEDRAKYGTLTELSKSEIIEREQEEREYNSKMNKAELTKAEIQEHDLVELKRNRRAETKKNQEEEPLVEKEEKVISEEEKEEPRLGQKTEKLIRKKISNQVEQLIADAQSKGEFAKTDYYKRMKQEMEEKNTLDAAYDIMDELNRLGDKVEADFKKKAGTLSGQELENARRYANIKIKDNWTGGIEIAEMLTGRDFKKEAEEIYPKLTKEDYASAAAVEKEFGEIIKDYGKDNDYDEILFAKYGIQAEEPDIKHFSIGGQHKIYKKDGQIIGDIKKDWLGRYNEDDYKKILKNAIKNQLVAQFRGNEKEVNRYRVREFVKVLENKKQITENLSKEEIEDAANSPENIIGKNIVGGLNGIDLRKEGKKGGKWISDEKIMERISNAGNIEEFNKKQELGQKEKGSGELEPGIIGLIEDLEVLINSLPKQYYQIGLLKEITQKYNGSIKEYVDDHRQQYYKDGLGRRGDIKILDRLEDLRARVIMILGEDKSEKLIAEANGKNKKEKQSDNERLNEKIEERYDKTKNVPAAKIKNAEKGMKEVIKDINATDLFSQE